MHNIDYYGDDSAPPAYDRDTLLSDLRRYAVEVLFKKVDGSQRKMRCSLRLDLLPESYVKEMREEKQFHMKNPNVIAAWDLDKNAWRSFRIDSIQYVQILDAYQ